MRAKFEDVRFVFLDRDGVINRKMPEGKYVARWSDVEILPGVEEAIATLNRTDRQVLVVSNQRGIALGHYTRHDVQSLHEQLQMHLASHGAHIDGFYYCPHDKDECDCRKPKTGMFEQAFRDFPGASATNSVMVGDSISDIQAAQALRMPSIFIAGDPMTQKEGAEHASAMADAVAESLVDAVRKLLS